MGLFLPYGRCGGRRRPAFAIGAAAAPDRRSVTDRIALALGLVILLGIGADLVLNEARALMFLLVKFADMIEWLAFWR